MTSTKEFRYISRSVETPFKFQLAVDFGNDAGPWFVFVVGKTAFAAGYLPKLPYLKTKVAKGAPMASVSPITGSA